MSKWTLLFFYTKKLCVHLRIMHFRKTFHIFYRSVRRISYTYQYTHLNTYLKSAIRAEVDTN